MPITAAQIKKLFPSAKADLVSAIVANWREAEAAGITTRKRKAMFFANVGPETGGLTKLQENMNYSAAGLRKTWPARFKTDAVATSYAKQPRKIANFVYGGRLGNRKGTDDGWNYRGSGMMQTTGRENYEKVGAVLGLDLVRSPELLRLPEYAFRSAVMEWSRRGCNAFADRGAVRECRKAINGGTNGLEDAIALYAKAVPIFADDGAVPVSLFAQPAPEPDDSDLKMADEPEADESQAPDPKLIELVQGQLRDKGYFEVGNADGKYGNRTRDAIMSFQSDNDLDITGEVSGDLLAQLASAPHRPVSDERANATAKDLAKAPTIDLANKAKWVLGLLGIGSTGNVLVDAKGAVDQGRDFLDAVKDISPWLVGAGLAGVGLYFAQRIIREQVKAYREGRHV